MYNPTPAAVAAPLLQQEHYLIQALQSSLAAPAQPQAQGLSQGLGQGFGQQPAQPAQEQALFPFPNLVAQVSAQQQPMALPVQGCRSAARMVPPRSKNDIAASSKVNDGTPPFIPASWRAGTGDGVAGRTEGGGDTPMNGIPHPQCQWVAPPE